MDKELAASPNPFPSAAVARLSASSGASISIATSAIESAMAYVDQHIEGTVNQHPPGAGDTRARGNILAIVGDYGTGKTHLALQLLTRLQGNDYLSTHTLYLDAPSDTFLSLYRDRFFPRLSRRDVKDRVMEYYSDVTAEALGGSELTEPAVELLRTRRTSPDKVVKSLGLMEAEVRKALHERLRRVTELEHFAIALTLLLRAEFEDAVWEWLGCSEPDQVLVERGIVRAIDSEQEALEAIGVIALIYGTQGRTFVLVIDELEKVMSVEGDRRPEAAVVLAFKKLLEVFGSTQAFLILCGLPDFLEVLPDDVKQRIGQLVRPTALTAVDAQRYIEESQQRATGQRRLEPFTEDAVQYIVELAGGNARKVIRFCYFVYQVALSAGVDITRAMIRNVAREQFESSDVSDVRAEALRVVDLNGWRVEEHKRFAPKSSAAQADYWLPAATGEGGIAVFVSSAILDGSLVKPFEQAAKAIRDSKIPVKTVLIVNGYLSNQQRKRVDIFDRIIVYEPRRFVEAFDAALTGFRKQLEDDGKATDEAIIRERLEELARQGNSIRGALDRLLQSSISSRHIQSAVDIGVRRVFGQIASSDSSQPIAIEDAAVDEVFREVEQVLEAAVRPLVSSLTLEFETPRADSIERLRGQSDLGWPLNDGPQVQSAAVAECILRAVRAFKVAVGKRLSSPLVQMRSMDFDSDFSELAETSVSVKDLCVAFDNIARALAPLVDWQGLLDRVASPVSIEGRQLEIPGLRQIDSSEFPAHLINLGPRVFRRVDGRRRGVISPI